MLQQEAVELLFPQLLFFLLNAGQEVVSMLNRAALNLIEI